MKNILHKNGLRTKFYMFVLFMFTSLLTLGQVTSQRTITVGDDVACGKLIDVELELTGTGTYSTPLEVVLVIDVSGSMSWANSDNTGTKIEDAVDAAENFVDNFFSDPNIHPDSKIGIVKFQSYATVVQGLTNDETFDDGDFWGVGYGDNFRANGGTNMEDGVEEAFGLLNHESACNITKTIIMLGDGAATSDNGSGDPSTRAILEALNAQSIAQVYTIGFNVGVGSSAENTLTEMQNAGYYAGASATDLNNIYTDILNQLSWVAKAPPSGVFNTEVVEGDFKIDNTTISVTKGSFLVNGQEIEWSVDYLNKDEVITLHYQLISNGICDDVNETEISSSGLTFLNANCETVEGSPLPTSIMVPCSGDEIIEICQGETSAEFISNIVCPDAGVISDLVIEGYAGNGSNNGDGDSWDSPGNIDADDGQTASLLLQSGDSKNLHATGFNFSSIPDNATINGITVEINRWASSSSGTNGVKDKEVRLLKAGSVVGNDQKKSGVWNTSSGTVVTYGGSTDLWGTSWSVSEIKNTNFGARLEVDINGSRSAHVDYIKIKVYYSITTVAGDLEWFTTESGGTSLRSGSVFSPIEDDPSFDSTIPGTYSYYAGCSNIPGCRKLYRIIVNELPTCDITGNITTCPSGTETYTAPAGMDSYSWSITSGTATINGATDAQTVEVIAGNCDEDFTLELTVTNSNGCSSICSLDVAVEDITPPTFDTEPGDLTVNCSAPLPYADYAAFVAAGGLASDNCTLNEASFQHVGDVPDTNTCEPTIQRTYRIADACGLNADYVQEITIEVVDFQMPANETHETPVACASLATEPTPPTVTDYCGNELTPSAAVKGGTYVDCEGTITYTFTYTDCDLNSHDWVYTYNVEVVDFQMPANETHETPVACASLATEPTPPTVTDYCGNELTPSAAVKGGTYVDCEGTITYTFTYTDCDLNSHDWVYTYNVEVVDFQMPANETHETPVACASLATEPTPPTVTDYCGNELTPSAAVKGGTYVDCEGTITYTFTYTDCDLNSHDWVYTYNVEVVDFQMPANETHETPVACASLTTEPTPPTVTDYCGNELTPSAAVKGGTYVDCEGTITYTFTYTDCDLNSHDWVYTYNVEVVDFQMPANETHETPVACASLATEPTPPTVTDYCGNELTPSAAVKGGTYVDCEGTITYTFTYTDCDLNSHDWVYTYNVEVVDFQMPANETHETPVACASLATEPTPPTVTDYCGNELTPSAAVKGGTYVDCEGTITYTFTYTDCDLNSHDWVYTYNVEVVDFQMPANETHETPVACASLATEPTPPTVTDYCGNELTPSAAVKGGTYVDCEGTITYTFTYTDCNLNSHDWVYTYNVEVVDFQMPANETHETPVACASLATEPTPPTVTDYCGNELTPSAAVKGGTYVDCEGTITYTFTYTDCDLNSHDWVYTYNVEVVDFQMPANETHETPVACASLATEPTPPTVTDYCGNELTPSAAVKGGTYVDCEGTITYTFTYTDCDLNSHDWVYTYNVEVVDFQMPANETHETPVACASLTTEPTPPTVTDYCGNELTPSAAVKGGTYVDCEGTITYTFTYTDCDLNSHDWVYTYNVEVVDFQMPANETHETPVACASLATEPTPPTVTDYCGNELTPSAAVKGGTYVDCEGTITYTFTYTDCDLNSHDWVYTYNVEVVDFQMPANETHETPVACASLATEPTPPTVTDYCGNELTPSAAVKGGTYVDCEGTITYTFTYTDCDLNSHDWVYTYNVEVVDFQMPANETHETPVACASLATEPTPPTVTDYCGNELTPSAAVKGGTYVDCEGTITYTFTYTDCNLNSHDWVYTYNVEVVDFQMPANETHETPVACASLATEPTPPTVTDYCGNELTPSAAVKGGTYVDCEGTITYTFTYTDCDLNSHDWVYTYNVEVVDFQMPANETHETPVACASLATEPTPPTVTDYCGNELTPSAAVKGGTYVDCEGTITYTFTYTDCDLNSHDWVYTYNVEVVDFQMPANETHETPVACASLATEPTPPTVTDYCGNELTPSAAVKGGTYVDCEGTITYTFTYTDCDLNSHDWVYTYNVEVVDFQMPANETHETPVACASLATEPTPPTVTDYCGNELTPSAAVKGGTYVDCEGTITYTFTYTDCDLNSHDWVYTYNVEVVDFQMPANETHETPVACASLATEPTPPTVTDYCGNELTPSAAVKGGTYVDCEGTITYTFTYTDCDLNSHDWVYTYNVEVVDFQMPANETHETPVACASLATEPTPPTVTDYCGNELTPSAAVKGGTYVDCEGTITYTFTYTDCDLNSHDWVYTYNVEVVDFVENMPADDGEIINCPEHLYTPQVPTVKDNCGNIITNVTGPVIDPIPGCEGIVNYVWTFTDCAGHSHDWTYAFTIERKDFAMPENTLETVACISDIKEITPPNVYDACGDLITPISGDEPAMIECEGDMVYTWTYTDCKGNTHDWSHTVTIEREDFIMPENTSETVACVTDFEGVTPPEVTDACGNMLTPVAGDEPAMIECEGDMVYTWTYTDCKGNTHDWSHTVTIEREDFIMPENTSETVACVADFEGVTPPEVTDACGNMLTPIAGDEPAMIECEGDMVYTWTYTDCKGNTHDWSHTVTIEREDFIMPENTSETVACVADFEGVTPPEVTDACGNMLTPVAGDEPAMIECEGDMVYTWTYTDCKGNTHDWSHTVTIEREDFIMPENTSETVACVADFEGVTPPEVTDACGNMLTPIAGDEPAMIECEGDMVYTWTYTDCKGNTHDWSHTVTIEREDFIMPENTSETVACVTDFEGVTPPEVTDACGNMLTPVAGDEPAMIECEGDMVYTWTYTDCKGNTHDWSHTVTIEREDFIMPENTSETVLISKE
ncbi:VWA domain-containing protein [uncultured Draconibacterium sp.]|uniref:HYR-like domain-containing protein n=1 Tax=uncultured Draconibacterium sp. TaxID=1573823 RepID=UPI0029C92526|nr:VWA domain-containing protein [uncultured Draconibacterium sp.]